ncbi:MAG: cobalamin-binding protein [Bacteroidetes bacterium]|nr:cobalamin-binding protein [Bacteroidota bacterium]
MNHRIVSLIPSATEIICALGFEENLVGKSHECDYPLSIKQLPVCSSSKVHTELASAQIDDLVRDIVLEGFSVYNVDSDLLDQLAPTMIVTQTQCEICAVSLSDVEKAISELVTSTPTIVSLEPMTLEDVWSDIQWVADNLGQTQGGEELIADLKGRLNLLCAQTKKITHKPKVACIEWIDPLMIAANWVPSLVELAGGVNLISEYGKHSQYHSMNDLLIEQPDVIAIMPCGFDIERCLQEMKPLTSDPIWNDLSAVKNGRVYVTDGNQYFNRPGPRVVESAEILSECFYPETFDFGHKGSGWIPWMPS